MTGSQKSVHRIKKTELSQCGHISRHNGISNKELLQGTLGGKRKRGTSRKMWLDEDCLLTTSLEQDSLEKGGYSIRLCNDRLGQWIGDDDLSQ